MRAQMRKKGLNVIPAPEEKSNGRRLTLLLYGQLVTLIGLAFNAGVEHNKVAQLEELNRIDRATVHELATRLDADKWDAEINAIHEEMTYIRKRLDKLLDK